MDAPYYSGAPGEMPYDDPARLAERPAARVLGHCHDCAEVDGEIVQASRWWYDGLREIPCCAKHYSAHDNAEPRYDSGL